ncbi:MAG: GIY-YIG nuclease family protein [Croceimicrobium sp.]
MAYIYIIHSSKWDRFYVGSCENIKTRLEDHNAGRNKSTRHGKPWILKYSETYINTKEARSREAEIKRKKSRKYLELLINEAK